MSFKQIKDIDRNCKVLGTDTKWHNAQSLPIETKNLYKVSTSKGSVVCSYDHIWTIYRDDYFPMEISTIELFNDPAYFSGVSVGRPKDDPDSAILLNVEAIGEGKCRCLSVDTKDHQYAIITDKGEKIFTHNCDARLVCGRVKAMASQMALGNSLGTSISSHKGAGIVAVSDTMAYVQFYLADTPWIKKWFQDRGLDEKGWPINKVEEENKEVDLGSDDEEIVMQNDDIHYEMDGIEKDVINRKEQKFKNV